MDELAGKTVVVIGGSAGIGYATAELALRHGARVILTSRDAGRAETARAKMVAATGSDRAVAGVVEITDRKGVDRFLAGHATFDHLCLPGSHAHRLNFENLDQELSHESFDTKVWGPFFGAYDGRRHMNKGGSIVFYSGAASRRPLKGYVVGAAIDGAIDAATRALAYEMAAEGIRVNCISPGIIDTEVVRRGRTEEEYKAARTSHAARVPLKRLGTALECAQGALYLMICGFVTGEVLAIDGSAEASP
jgi:NAD(P)-dependent dehydrogenase (short-subunit alcohol dehydrogenase family)